MYILLRLTFLAHDFNNQFDSKRNMEDTIDKSSVVPYRPTEKELEKGERKKFSLYFAETDFF